MVGRMAGAAGASADEPPLPAYLLTRRRRWCSLIVVCCALAVANGPVLTWQTLVPIMIEDEGVFRSTGHPLYHLDTIFAIGNGLGALTNLPAGMVFDRIGPRKTAIIGALFTSVGLVGLGLCMHNPSLNGGMYFFYPLTTIFAFLNSWGAFAYLWLIPESPALVNACICAAFSLSDCLGLLAAVLHNNHGVSLHAFFFTLGAGAMVTAWVSAMLLPGKEEFLRLAANAKQEQLCVAELAAEAEASAMSEKAAPSVTATASAKARVAAAAEAEAAAAIAAEAEAEAAEAALPRHCSGRAWTACVPALERGLLRDTWACVVLLYPRASLVVLAHLLGLYLLPLSLLLKQYGYYLALFGETTATELVNLFSLLLGVCGAVSVICFGFVADRLGLIRSFVLVDCLALLFAAAVLAPGVAAQATPPQHKKHAHTHTHTSHLHRHPDHARARACMPHIPFRAFPPCTLSSDCGPPRADYGRGAAHLSRQCLLRDGASPRYALCAQRALRHLLGRRLLLPGLLTARAHSVRRRARHIHRFAPARELHLVLPSRREDALRCCAVGVRRRAHRTAPLSLLATAPSAWLASWPATCADDGRRAHGAYGARAHEVAKWRGDER